MKKMLTLLCLLWGTAAFAAEGDFTKAMTADELAKTGLGKLSPEELAQLKAVVERYKTGEVAVVKQEAEAKVAAVQQEAETKVAAVKQEAEIKVAGVQKEAETKVAVLKHEAETKVAAAEAKAKQTETVSADGKKKPGWFSALLTLKRAADKPEEAEPLTSTLVGDFRGWSGGTIFTLEDGTRWVQQNRPDVLLYSPAIHSPKVKIYPATKSGFWFEIEGVSARLRVLPYESKVQK